MPFVFIFVGAVMVISGVRGTSAQLLTLLKSDVTGQNNFVYWILSILAIGALGYVDALKPLSRAFLVLVIVGLVINDNRKTGGGFFTSFQNAVSQITKSGS